MNLLKKIVIILSTTILLAASVSSISRPPGSLWELVGIENVKNLKEFKLIHGNTTYGSVVALHFSDTYISAYYEDGYLRNWDLADYSLINEFFIGLADTRKIEFSTDSNFLIGPLYNQIRDNGYDELVEYIGGIGVWDTSTGQMIFCYSLSCETDPSSEDIINSIDDLGVTISSSGHWVTIYSEYGLTLKNLSRRSLTTIYGVHPDYWETISIVKFRPGKKQYAFAYREGHISVSSLNPIFIGRYRQLGEEGEELKTILALEFSPDGKWLARIMDGQLDVWQLHLVGDTMYNYSNTPEAHMLKFGTASELLYVLEKDQIIVIDLDQVDEESRIKLPNITSFAISKTMLVWGDEMGNIHIWGLDEN